MRQANESERMGQIPQRIAIMLSERGKSGTETEGRAGRQADGRGRKKEAEVMDD